MSPESSSAESMPSAEPSAESMSAETSPQQAPDTMEGANLSLVPPTNAEFEQFNPNVENLRQQTAAETRFSIFGSRLGRTPQAPSMPKPPITFDVNAQQDAHVREYRKLMQELDEMIYEMMTDVSEANRW